MEYTARDHTFVVCAYQESRYLEACIASLECQRQRGSIIVSTSTPNRHIELIAQAHRLPVCVNRGESGIAEDWNFAYQSAGTRLVTLAHQDDVYDEGYLEHVLERINGAHKPLICFTNYFELRNGERVFARGSRLLRTKEIALLPLKPRVFQNSRWVRRRILSVCNPICCPSVTYVRENLPEKLFDHHFASNVDWQAWEAISRMQGSFCYVDAPLMGHRIHAESTTTQVIGDNDGRTREDLEMLMKFWPRPVAKLINRAYSKGQKSNSI